MKIYFKLCVCVWGGYVHLCAQVLKEARKGTESPGGGVIGGCELPVGCGFSGRAVYVLSF